jgi:hypothetical protein
MIARMRRRLRLLAAAATAALALGAGGVAHADPITAAVVTFVNFVGGATIAAAVGNFLLAYGATVYSTAALWALNKVVGPKSPSGAASASQRLASVTTLSLGEAPRQALFGRGGLAGSLDDAFNWGGDNATDWEGLAITLVDHPCEALEGVWVNDAYVDLTSHSDGVVPGYNDQLEVYYRSGLPGEPDFPADFQGMSPALASGALAATARVFVAYKADPPDSQAPTWTGRPAFVWVLKGKRCYDPRLDSSVPGGSGAHRWDDPSTWAWSENPAVCCYNYQRGIFAKDLVGQAEMLLVGRGLSAIEAPGQNIFAHANVCDELAETDDAGGQEPRYRCGGVVLASDAYGVVEQYFADAMGGVIIQHEGQILVEPGQAKTPVADLTDADLVVGASIQRGDFKSASDRVNTILPRYPEPTQKYAETAGDVCRDLTDIALDGGAKEETLSLVLVPYKSQARRLGEIRRRLVRMERTLGVTLMPKWAGLEEGDWVTKTGALTTAGVKRTFRVAGYSAGPDWRNTLALQEIDASVFGFGGASSDPYPAQPAPLPDALVLKDVTAQAIQMEGTDGSLLPAIRFTWATPVATGVLRIRAEVRKLGEAVIAPSVIDAVGEGQANVTNGVAWASHLEARLVPMGGPGRAVVPSPWLAVTTEGAQSYAASTIDGMTPAQFRAALSQATQQGDYLTQAALETFLRLSETADTLWSATLHNGQRVKRILIGEDEAWVEGEASLWNRTEGIAILADDGFSMVLNQDRLKWSETEAFVDHVEGIRTQIGSDIAAATDELHVWVDTESAGAEWIASLEASFGNNFHGSITQIASVTSDLGASWTLSLNVNGKVSGIRSHNGGSVSSIVFVADQIGFTSGAGDLFPLAVVDGVVRATNFEADRVKAHSVVADSIVGGAVSAMAGDVTGGDGASCTITTLGGPVSLTGYAEIGTAAGAGAAGVVARLYRNGSEIGSGAVYCPNAWGNAGVGFPVFDHPTAGTYTYSIGCEATPGSGVYTVKKTGVVAIELHK